MVLLPVVCDLGRALGILLYKRGPVSNSFICRYNWKRAVFLGGLILLVACVLERALKIMLVFKRSKRLGNSLYADNVGMG